MAVVATVSVGTWLATRGGRKAELAVLRGAEPAERRVAEAAVVAVRLAADHHAATAALDEAKAAFGDRRRLDHRALTRALGDEDMPD